MRSGAKGGGQGWTALLADDSKGVHGKSISPATSPRGRSLLWFTLRVRLGNLGFVGWRLGGVRGVFGGCSGGVREVFRRCSGDVRWPFHPITFLHGH